jgi:hypothetical protein
MLFAIAEKNRIGPDADVEFPDGKSRSGADRKLGSQHFFFKLDDGNVAAVYEYLPCVCCLLKVSP